jgi:hypothetical protein
MAVFRLPRLPVNWREQPQLFEKYWDEAMTELEKTLNAILSIPEIEAALEDLDEATQIALDAAEAAQTAADNAQGAADGTTAETSIVNSYVSNFTPPLISADEFGVVTIATHDRVYGDSTLNPTVSVTGDAVATAAAPSSVVRIYYDDPTRSGGAVSYQFTIDPAAPPVQGGNRHSVGAVSIPAAGSQDGNYVRPPGYVEN